jgi:cytochrome c oxidase subunit 2
VATVPVGVVVEFRVTTLDVNHGFSLYAPDGSLMAQTQAMPGYVNRLRVVFDKPGMYTVLCLEFCGMSHHRMRGVVEVQ